MIKTSYDQDILWTRHFLKSCLQLSYDRLLMIVYLWSRHLMIKTNFQELSSIILWSSTYDQDILWSRQILKSCLKLSYDRLQVNTSICWVRYLMIKSSYDQDTLWSRHLMIKTSYDIDILWSRHLLMIKTWRIILWMIVSYLIYVSLGMVSLLTSNGWSLTTSSWRRGIFAFRSSVSPA